MSVGEPVDKKEKKRRGIRAYVKPLLDARSSRLLAPTTLGQLWRVPTHVVEMWIKREPGVIVWKRRTKKRGMKNYYRVPLAVAERIRVLHGIDDERLGKAARKILAEAEAERGAVVA